MLQSYKQEVKAMSNVLDRFLKYVKICTTSDEESSSFPSSPFQTAFGEALADECLALGLTDVKQDKYGYVSALLPSNFPNSKTTSEKRSYHPTALLFSVPMTKPA